MADDTADVAILGAGPAGLMAAWTAARAGHRCTVIEAADRVGGMAGSFEIAGHRVDYGSHRLHPAAPRPTLDLIGHLLGPDLQVRPRNGRLRLADRWVGFPLRTGQLLRTLPPGLVARLTLDAATVMTARVVDRVGRDGPPSDFEAEVTARLGPTVNDRFYGPYARKLYGFEPHELDRELALRRVSAGSPVDVARRLVRARRPSGRVFLYPRRGYGQIVERLAEAAIDAGVDLRLSTAAESVRIGGTGNDGAIVTTSGDRASRHVEADVVLSTIPIGRLAGIVHPRPPTEVLDAVARTGTRAMLLVYLVLDRPQYTPFDAHYIPGPETAVARLSEPKNYRDGDDPAGTTVLCAEVPCRPDDDLLRLSAEDLGVMVADDLIRIGLPATGPIGVETRFLPSVYPVFDRAGRTSRTLVDGWADGIDRVLPLGRQGLAVIDNLHHVLDMGAAAANVIGPDGAIDRAAWARSRERFAHHTVED